MHSRLIGPTGAATANPVLSAFQNSHASIDHCWNRDATRRTCLILELNARRQLKQRLVHLAVCFIAQKAYRVFVLWSFQGNLKRSLVRLEIERDFAAVDLQPEWFASEAIDFFCGQAVGSVLLEILQLMAKFKRFKFRRRIGCEQ